MRPRDGRNAYCLQFNLEASSTFTTQNYIIHDEENGRLPVIDMQQDLHQQQYNEDVTWAMAEELQGK